MNKNLLIILAVSALVFGANIWGTSIYVLDEAKNSGCAWEMSARNAWVVPTFNGQLRTDKPPLHYFFMKLSYQFFGVNPFSARLFSVVMGMLTILSVYFFTRAVLSEQTAFIAALILISSVQLAIQFHLAVPDPYLIFLLTSGLLAFYYAFTSKNSRFYYIFYVCLSLATLTKGPLAIVISGLIILIFLISTRSFNLNTIKQMKVFQGVIMFFLLVAPWYIAVGMKTDGVWLDQFLFKHNVGRFTSSMEGHGGFPLASFVILIVGLLPFSFFFPQMLKLVWQQKNEKPFLLFCFIAMMVVIVFFAFSRTILPTYPEPALPFFAILLGYFFQTAAREVTTKKYWVSALAYTVITLVLPVVIWLVLKQDKMLQDLSYLAAYFIILNGGALVGLYFIARKRILSGFYSYVISLIAFMLVFFYIIFPQVDKRNPVTKSLPLLQQRSRGIYFYKDFNPAYVMALKTIIPPLDIRAEHNGIYVISQKKYIAELNHAGYKLIFEGQDLFESPITIIVGK